MQSVEFSDIKPMSTTMRESVRALRTNLQFCGDDVRTILFTSSVPNEGVCLSKTPEGFLMRAVPYSPDKEAGPQLVKRIRTAPTNPGQFFRVEVPFLRSTPRPHK